MIPSARIAVQLEPGEHQIMLVSKEFDLKRTLTIRVRSGETVTRSVEMMQ